MKVLIYTPVPHILHTYPTDTHTHTGLVPDPAGSCLRAETCFGSSWSPSYAYDIGDGMQK